MYNIELQVLWLDNSLGLAVNKKVDQGVVPLTSYYFWPVSNAWEQIRFELNSKPWLEEDEQVQILNLIVDVMNQWQQSRILLNKSKKTTKKKESLDSFNIVGLP